MITSSNRRTRSAILLILGAGVLQGCVYAPYPGTSGQYPANGGYPDPASGGYGYPAYGAYGYPYGYGGNVVVGGGWGGGYYGGGYYGGGYQGGNWGGGYRGGNQAGSYPTGHQEGGYRPPSQGGGGYRAVTPGGHQE